MKCPKCQKEGKESKVFPHGSSTTLMHSQPFYDEKGKYHDHDPNITTSQYSCSNGHRWTEKNNSICWCGWGK